AALCELPRAPRSPFDHHRCGLDERGRGLTRLQVELLGRFTRDDCDHSRRTGGLELDLGQETVDGHCADDSREAIAGRKLMRLWPPTYAMDLGKWDEAAVGRVPLGVDPAAAIPA